MNVEPFSTVAVTVTGIDAGVAFRREQFGAELPERGPADEGGGATAAAHAQLAADVAFPVEPTSSGDLRVAFRLAPGGVRTERLSRPAGPGAPGL